MGIIRVGEVPLGTNQYGIKARRVLDTPPFRIMNLVLEPGQVVPRHTSPVEVFFYVVTGGGEISIGDMAHAVTAGDVLPCPKETPMSLHAGPDGMSVLNVKAPNPATLAEAKQR